MAQKKYSHLFLIIPIFFIVGWYSSLYYASTYGKPLVTFVPTTIGTKQDTLSKIIPYKPIEEKTSLNKFWEVWSLLDDKYYDHGKLDDQKRIYGAIKGMVSSTGDPYTIYLNPDETKEFELSLSGELEGIGAELSAQDGNLIVVSPLKGSPAEKAGLKPKDIIYKINGENASEMTLYQAITKIRGKEGTKVTLVIIRKGINDPMDLTITREKINIPSVTWEQKESNIAYININQFGENTESGFKKAVNELLLGNPKGIILDLRYNGGGYLDSSVNILSEFIHGEKEAVIVKSKDPSQNEILRTGKSGRLENIPVVVLVNEGTASAAEIVAGALQDYKRATIVGQQTFGKGSIQEIDDLDDGSSLRMTIAKWFTPLDRTIDKVGLTPDIIVEKPTKTDQVPSTDLSTPISTDNSKSVEETDFDLNKALEVLKGKINQ